MISMRRTQGRFPEEEKDEDRLESVQRQRSGTLIEKLLGVLSGVTLAALVLSLVGQTTGQSLLKSAFHGTALGWTRPGARPDQGKFHSDAIAGGHRKARGRRDSAGAH